MRNFKMTILPWDAEDRPLVLHIVDDLIENITVEDFMDEIDQDVYDVNTWYAEEAKNVA